MDRKSVWFVKFRAAPNACHPDRGRFLADEGPAFRFLDLGYNACRRAMIAFVAAAFRPAIWSAGAVLETSFFNE
jgi:hypothetical protein